MAHVRLTKLPLFAACLAIAGCTSTISAQTARPLPADDKLVFASGGAHYSAFCIECTHYNWIPHAELGFRSGVNDRMDFGLELGTYGYLQSDLKIGIVRSERFGIAVAPALSLNTAFFQAWGLFSLMLEASRLQTVAPPQNVGLSEEFFSLPQLALSVQYRFVAAPDREIAMR